MGMVWIQNTVSAWRTTQLARVFLGHHGLPGARLGLRWGPGETEVALALWVLQARQEENAEWCPHSYLRDRSNMPSLGRSSVPLAASVAPPSPPTTGFYRSALMPGNARHTALSLSFQETPSKCQCSACWQCQSQTNRSPNEQISTCGGGEENDTRVSDLNPESHHKSPTFPNDNDHGPIIKCVTSSKSLHQTLFRHKAS